MTTRPRLSIPSANRLAVGAYLVDHDVRGLYLRRQSEASTAWSLMYRVDGKQRRLTLGAYPTIGIDAARTLARTALLAIAEGRDPAAERQARRTAPTVRDLMEAYGRRSQLADRAAKTARNERAWHALIVDTIGDRRVGEIDTPDLDAVKRAGVVAKQRREDREAAQTGRPARTVPPSKATANRCLVQLCAAMAWASGPPLRWQVPDPRPLKRAVELYPERRRNRRATPAELAAAWPLILALPGARGSAILAILMTGARVGEIVGALRSQIETTEAGARVLVLTDHKTAHTGDVRRIALPAAVVDLIDATPDDGTGRLFPVAYDLLAKDWTRIRETIGSPDLQLRDLRTTFASVTGGTGAGLAEIGGLLGHRSAQTTKGYVALLDDNRAALAERTAAAIVGRGQGRQSYDG
jgi:integrase